MRSHWFSSSLFSSSLETPHISIPRGRSEGEKIRSYCSVRYKKVRTYNLIINVCVRFVLKLCLPQISWASEKQFSSYMFVCLCCVLHRLMSFFSQMSSEKQFSSYIISNLTPWFINRGKSMVACVFLAQIMSILWTFDNLHHTNLHLITFIIRSTLNSNSNSASYRCCRVESSFPQAFALIKIFLPDYMSAVYLYVFPLKSVFLCCLCCSATIGCGRHVIAPPPRLW